jgi:uncharacterized protein involved in tolerance to divalent cations
MLANVCSCVCLGIAAIPQEKSNKIWEELKAYFPWYDTDSIETKDKIHVLLKNSKNKIRALYKKVMEFKRG